VNLFGLCSSGCISQRIFYALFDCVLVVGVFIAAKDNVIVNPYFDSGIKSHNAFMFQALLQLNKYYCTQKKCLNCGIGIKILKK